MSDLDQITWARDISCVGRIDAGGSHSQCPSGHNNSAAGSTEAPNCVIKAIQVQDSPGIQCDRRRSRKGIYGTGLYLSAYNGCRSCIAAP